MPSEIPIDEADVRDVSLLVRSHHPLLFVSEYEAGRVLSLLQRVAVALDMPLYTWKAHRGLVRHGGDGNAVYKTEPIGQCLANVASANAEVITYLYDFEGHFDTPEIHARLHELHDQLSRHRGALVVSGAIEDLPSRLSRFFTPVKLSRVGLEAYRDYVSRVVDELSQRQPVRVQLTSAELAELLEHLRGLPFDEVRKVVTQALVDNGRLDRHDIEAVLEAKKRAVERAGVLEYLPLEPGAAPIVGLRRFRDWLEKRRVAFTEPARAQQLALPSPRGVLLTGVQGCGKSLSAKALSSSFRLPLLRLDPGTLFRKYVGESEQNLRRALSTAERVAPCVLWIDEIEKAFSTSGDSDGGTGRRMFGTFLTWLQEKDASVFVFATANDISGLPPELLRKGRFDEIFFVDLPNLELRAHVFALHLARRGHAPEAFELQSLADATEGFSGAEIEQVVVAGLYSAFARDEALSTEILLEEVGLTRPLSVTMSEKISALRQWARGRAIPADDHD